MATALDPMLELFVRLTSEDVLSDRTITFSRQSGTQVVSISGGLNREETAHLLGIISSDQVESIVNDAGVELRLVRGQGSTHA